MRKSKKFSLDVGWMLAGTIIVFFLHFLQKPIIARYLGPEDLGLYSMVLTIGEIIMLIAGMGINGAIVKYTAEYKEDKYRLQQMFSSALLIIVIFGVVSIFVLYLLSDNFVRMINMPSISSFLKLYAFIIPFSLVYGINIGLLNGLREMKYYSFFNILNNIMIFIFAVSLLYLGFGIKGAVIGNMLASIVMLFISIFIIKKFLQFKIHQVKEEVKNLISFGSKLMMGNIINNVNYQADILLIAYFLSATDVGYYSVAISMSRFFWRIPQSIQMVAYPVTTEFWAKGEIQSLNKMIDKSMKYSTSLLLTIGLTIWFFAKDIIIFLFGESFSFSVIPFQILVIGTVIYGIIIPIGSTLSGIGRPDLSFKISSISAFANILLNISLVPSFGIVGAAMSTTISLTISAVLTIYYMLKYAKVNINIKWFSSIFAFTILLLAIFFTCSKWLNIYLLGASLLIIFIGINFKFFLTREDKKTFAELFRPTVLKS